MEHVNAHLIRNIQDIPELKTDLTLLSGTLTHKELAEYALKLGNRILELSGLEPSPIIVEGFSVLISWQNGLVRFQEALEFAGQLNRLAKDEKDPIKAKAYRALGQVMATPHVRWHALVASEYAIVLINLLYPQNLDRVETERRFQVNLMESCRTRR